jgi:hypothetical protein
MRSDAGSNKSSDSDLNELKEEVEKGLTSLRRLSAGVKKEKNQDTKEMIRYFGDLTNNMETRRIRITDFAWQSLTIGLTAFGVLWALPIVIVLKISFLLVLATVLIMALLKIRESEVQSHFRYPFLKFPEYGNKWKWFYYGNAFIPKMNDNPSDLEKRRADDERLYLRGLDLFVTSYSRETIDRELHDNLIQLFLLQVHNYYKNRFYLRLLNYDLMTPRILLGVQIVYWIAALGSLASNSVPAAFLLAK